MIIETIYYLDDPTKLSDEIQDELVDHEQYPHYSTQLIIVEKDSYPIFFEFLKSIGLNTVTYKNMSFPNDNPIDCFKICITG